MLVQNVTAKFDQVTNKVREICCTEKITFSLQLEGELFPRDGKNVTPLLWQFRTLFISD